MRMHRSVLKATSTRMMPRDKTLPKDLQLKKWKIYKGDKVIVTAGKDRGQTGTVAEVSRKTNSVYVRGLKLAFKNVPKTVESPTGKIQKEMAIHVSNLALVDPSTNQPTKVRVGLFTDPDTGVKEKRRYSASSGSVIHKVVDLSYQKSWKDGAFDTQPELVSKVTFQAVPGVPPFPEDVIRELQNRHKKLF
ncbi:39S ribosomal protein L24, mitochondrial [Kickxella alabastrina]|uniref:39S ribosomal protein L24, mitochondrial n=1 Tax=Kickxella alabastrina TaxID=61397 RepID=A0ACC1I5Z0_9FUNG|nr:39S ribosomal protein L24, mitochondrial [Kickxella alabastrina]